jgi:hypothetical protein
MRSEGQNELVEKLQWVKDQIEKYKSAQKQRLAKSKNKPANE